MTGLIVVISRDDTYMHVGPPDTVAEHLFGERGDVDLPLRPSRRLEHRGAGERLGFADIDTYDEAGRVLEWAVDRRLRPVRVHEVPGTPPEPDRLLLRMQAVVAHLDAQIQARADLEEFRDGFYAERLVTPPDLADAVSRFADLGRPEAGGAPSPAADEPVHAHGAASAHSFVAHGPIGTGSVHLPDVMLTPDDPGSVPPPPPPPPGHGSIPHSGSWFHNLMHRITGT